MLQLAVDAFDLARADATLTRLCAEDFAGRRIGTHGHDRAQAWLASVFRSLGLETERFRFRLQSEVLEVGASPLLEIAEYPHTLRYRAEFAEHPLSPSFPGPVAGHWAINQGDLRTFAAEAKRRGYIGVLVPQSQTPGGYLSKRIVAREPVELPVIAIASGLASALGGRRLRARLLLRRVRAGGAHVVCHLTGQDAELEQEPLLVSAHYDGVGDDTGGTRLPGAADNATGVAVLLELARIFAARESRPARPILFVALDGEELDAGGSKAYAEALRAQGLKPMVLNLDMAARINETIAIEPGPESETILDALDRAGAALALPLAIANVSSDNRRFAQVGFPSVGVALGGTEIHSPADVYETVEIEAMRVAGSLLAATIEQMAW